MSFNPYVLKDIQDAPAVKTVNGKKKIYVSGDRAYAHLYDAVRVYKYDYSRKLWICQEEIPSDSKYLY